MTIPKSVHTDAYRLFLEKLRTAREEAGLSQRALARLLDMPHSYVNKCESGERQLNIVELRQWCLALQISWIEFIQELETSFQDNKL